MIPYRRFFSNAWVDMIRITDEKKKIWYEIRYRGKLSTTAPTSAEFEEFFRNFDNCKHTGRFKKFRNKKEASEALTTLLLRWPA